MAVAVTMLALAVLTAPLGTINMFVILMYATMGLTEVLRLVYRLADGDAPRIDLSDPAITGLAPLTMAMLQHIYSARREQRFDLMGSAGFCVFWFAQACATLVITLILISNGHGLAILAVFSSPVPVVVFLILVTHTLTMPSPYPEVGILMLICSVLWFTYTAYRIWRRERPREHA